VRRLAVLCLLASCGRLGFDPIQGDDVVPATCEAAPEPNNTTATATPLALDTETGGRLCKDDSDVFAIELTAGDEVAVSITPEGAGWPTIELIGNDGPRAQRTYASRLTGFADRTGTFYVRVAGVAPVDGTPYHLTVTKLAGRHWFIAPAGNDAAAGTFEMPLKTFGPAIGRLVPGDTLVLRDGDYTVAQNGFIYARCNVDAMSGTAAAPIRVVAFTERRAFMLSDGVQNTLRLEGGCAYWSIEGLRVENQDNPASGTGAVISLVNTSNIAIRRVLARHNNRYVNTHVISISNSSDILVEDTEVYDFHRDGLQFFGTTRATARRVIVNSRGNADVSGGFASMPPDKGDSGITASHSTDTLIENSISEGNGTGDGTDSGYDVDSVDARHYGNIALGNDYGFTTSILVMGAQNTFRTRYENCIAVSSLIHGFYVRSNMDASCTGCTAINSQVNGWSADQLSLQPRSSSSHCINCLAVGNGTNGFMIQQQDAGWSLESVSSFGNGTAYSPATAPEMISPMQTNPQLGGCLVYQPSSAPLRGVGVGGGTVGGEVVYRYQDGVPTSVPLWDPVTGAFPCGAIVEGVNDDAATSCVGIHQRLHVGAANCALPYPPL
jgi:hypothetical protein